MRLPTRVFNPTQAKYYCASFHGSTGLATGSIQTFIDDCESKGVTTLAETNPIFDEYRDCSLRDAERRLFLAVSNYRRALDLMMVGAAHWTQVTLYYASFFAASAFMEMFGSYLSRSLVVEVLNHNPGSQELLLSRRGMRALKSTCSGPHERFWKLFYINASSLYPWVDQKLRNALLPIDSDEFWQTKTRNTVNYDTYFSVELMTRFMNDFDPNTFPGCLQGELNKQRVAVHGMIELAFAYATQFGLSTDALNALPPTGGRGTKVQRLVLDGVIPNISAKLSWTHVL